MAVIALEKLEEQLNCSICLDTYTSPKLLQCNHVYCQQCLVKLIFRDQQGQIILTCPNCRQVTPVPACGVKGLQSAFRVNQLLEIVEEQKKAVSVHKKEDSVSTTSTSPDSISVVCPEHGGREVELYCNTCEKPICFKCIMKDEEHPSHDYEELDKAYERYQEEIVSSLNPLERQLETIKKALRQLNVRSDEISHQQAIIETDIHNTVARIHETLDIRKTELINQLHQLTQTKLKTLATQKDQIETTHAQLSSCLLFMRENLKTGNQSEALMMKGTTVRQMKELTTTFQPDLLEPCTEADMIFSTLEDISAVCKKYGQVFASISVDPFKCYVTGKDLETAVVGEKSSALLQILNSDSLPDKEHVNFINCTLVSEITGTRVGCSVERKGESQYEISYQPTIKGRHQLYIKIRKRHIKGSPFSVSVLAPVKKLGTPISTIHDVKKPMDVAVNQKGEVMVTEGGDGRCCVTVFRPSGERLRSFDKFISGGRGKYLNPDGIAVDGEGNTFVADRITHHIRKYSLQGNLLKDVCITGGSTDLYPRGIAYSSSTDMIYATAGDHVQILHSDLQLAGMFGKSGGGNGEFDNPRHVACDSTGNVYVVDQGNHRIQVFTAEGRFLRKFGRPDKGRGMMLSHHGIAVGSDGTVYVSEYVNNCVSVFTSSGQFLKFLDIAGQCRLRGLAVDSSGVLYVCDESSGSVRLF